MDFKLEVEIDESAFNGDTMNFIIFKIKLSNFEFVFILNEPYFIADEYWEKASKGENVSIGNTNSCGYNMINISNNKVTFISGNHVTDDSSILTIPWQEEPFKKAYEYIKNNRK